MSIEVPIDQLFDDVGRWGAGFLLTISDGGRVHLLALRPSVVDVDGARVLRFDGGGGRACRNAYARPDVTVVFPPGADTGAPDGMSLVIDGTAEVEGDLIDVTPTSVLLHRKAPPAP